MNKFTVAVALAVFLAACPAWATNHWKTHCQIEYHSPRDGREVTIEPKNEWLDEYEVKVHDESHPLEKGIWSFIGKNRPIFPVGTPDDVPGHNGCPQYASDKERKNASDDSEDFLRVIRAGFRYFYADIKLHEHEDRMHSTYIVPVNVQSTNKVHLLFFFVDLTGEKGVPLFRHAGVAHGDPD